MNALHKFMDMEGLMKARLEEKFAGTGVKVFSAADLQAVASNAQVAPAVQVFYGGFKVLQEQDNGATQEVEQRWFAVPVVRNAAAQLSGEGARAAAGELMQKAFEALLGFRAGAPFSALRLYDGPAPAWIKGLGYHPLGFKTKLTVRGDATKL